ncbi:unnamed protein product [Caenorhabditis bovis]|uniref:EGF-like domain-containing protein n=1 Tax=Caenorhabditis bovis TaxID=2654633 RepID=A0A8S1ECR2_9PELO|nr:unnamed protein product [Caenorhabditis bovis]
MTVEKCNDYAISSSPDLKYLTICGVWCVTSTGPLLNDTVPYWTSNCNKECGGDYNQICGQHRDKCRVYEVAAPTYDPNPCNDTNLCNATFGHGICLDYSQNYGLGYGCICAPGWTGKDCNSPVDLPCDSNPCENNGTCINNFKDSNFICECNEGFTGDKCQYEDPCIPNPCRYGGTCEPDNGKAKCTCLEFYSGSICSQVDRCAYHNPCAHGSCQSIVKGIQPNYECTCEPGWNGTNCDTMINYCDPEPCAHGSVCNPFFQGYECECVPGTTGKNCDTVIDQCQPYWDNGWIKSPCNTKDEGAICTTGINTFTCNCTEQWTDRLCDMNVLIRDVLIAIYGYVDENMIPLLNDLIQNPSQIKDMVPFITGLLSEEQRSDLSWDTSDIFEWIAYEDKRLNLDTDVVRWNDIVLGNCFTFNHHDANFTYLMRNSGRHGGLKAFMRARQDEYAPWYDTAGINVFIHNSDEYVFSESTKYTRLGGRYGKCIKKPSEVKAYYYPYSYSSDGCLRTCYQDMSMEKCGCMDPRYPRAPNATSCQLSDRTCVTDASEEAGDPSTWPSCVCPLPCSNAQYSVTWSKTDFALKNLECDAESDPDKCYEIFADKLLITVVLPQLDYKIYSESPTMDFNKFLSQLGGQLGVLMGINLVSFIEIAFLMFGLIMVCCRKYEN